MIHILPSSVSNWINRPRLMLQRIREEGEAAEISAATEHEKNVCRAQEFGIDLAIDFEPLNEGVFGRVRPSKDGKAS